MESLQRIAEELVGLKITDVQNLAAVMKDECGIESAAQKARVVVKPDTRVLSPKDYGMMLKSKKHKNNRRW